MRRAHEPIISHALTEPTIHPCVRSRQIPAGDARVPDVIGIAKYGTVFTGGTGKIAEHGGDNPQDRDVALVVSGAGVAEGKVVTISVETTQIAPTILDLLGLNPGSLQAVQAEGTKVLPGA